MDLESVRNHCLAKNGTITEEFPFDEEVLVFKLFGKIFLLTNVNEVPLTMNLKCDPERAIELRERYPAVQPGFHMHKKMWNTVTADGSLSAQLIFGMIDHSYDEVAKKLPKAVREKLTESQKSGNRGQRTEVKSKKLENRGERAEVRGQRTKVKSKVKSKKLKIKSKKSEDREQKSEFK